MITKNTVITVPREKMTSCVKCGREVWPPAPDILFFSSRRRHTSYWRDWSQTCALPISPRDTLLAQLAGAFAAPLATTAGLFEARSEERRVGKECRSRWTPNK